MVCQEMVVVPVPAILGHTLFKDEVYKCMVSMPANCLEPKCHYWSLSSWHLLPGAVLAGPVQRRGPLPKGFLPSRFSHPLQKTRRSPSAPHASGLAAEPAGDTIAGLHADSGRSSKDGIMSEDI